MGKGAPAHNWERMSEPLLHANSSASPKSCETGDLHPVSNSPYPWS